MEPACNGVLLRVFIGAADRSGGHSLCRAIIDVAFKGGLAGTTVLQGPMGFGQSRYVNNEFVVDSPGNLPIVIEIIDTPEKIEAFLPQIDGMISSGLVTMEKVRMARAGCRTPGASEFVLGGEASAAPAAAQVREEPQMEVPHEALLLRIFTSVADRYGVEQPLYQAIVMKARKMNLAGATVLKGPIGFGLAARMHEGNLFEKDDRPVVIEICDSEEKIKAFLPVLDEIMESGLVTIEKARVIRYGRQRSSYLERLKKSVREHLHLSPSGAKPSGPVRS